MRKLITCLALVIFFSVARAQNPMIEVYKDSLRKQTTDTGRAVFLYFLSYYYQNYKPDSAMVLARSAYSLSLTSDFERGKIGALGQIAFAYKNLGNSSKALEYYLEQLKLIEKQKDVENIASSYLSIALVYNGQKDLQKALFYAYKADSIAKTNHLTEVYLYTTLDIGDIYSNNDQLDSASLYTTICYNECIRLKDSLNTTSLTGISLNNLGNIFFKARDYDKALNYFRISIPYLDSTQNYKTLAECYYGLAQIFEEKQLPDSALHYAARSYRLASNNLFLKNSLDASHYLSALYRKQNNADSAFAYLETYVALKDSFASTERIRQMQNMTITEQERQEQLALQKIADRKEQKLRLELLLVGMFIPFLFLVTAFISGRKVHRRLIRFLGIFSVLFLFEYVTLLLHPWIMEKTGHKPVYEIFIFVAIAALISPLHHRIEHWITENLARRHYRKMIAATAPKPVTEEQSQ